MIMKLRSYQKELVELSSGSDNVLLQADTGAGKTPVLAEIAKTESHIIIIAHRRILVKQISRTLTQFGIQHAVLATKHTQRQCITAHRKIGRDGFVDPSSTKIACSIDSLLSRWRRGLLQLDTKLPWVFLVDEAHHMVDGNKWGQLAKIFPNARFIGVTATPCRLDQVSLAAGRGGVFDRLEIASELKINSVRTLIEKGFLSDFKAYSLPERIDNAQLKMGAYDYTYSSIERATNTVIYQMVGDAIDHYRRLANNTQALAFCPSIQTAQKTADAFKQSDIPAAAIHSKMSAVEVARIFDLFECGVIKLLCNVDMIGEGADVPAIECLIMLRKTASFGLYRQWVGRGLRPFGGKRFAILIDCTGNVRAHGLPDKHIEWSLENPPQAVKSNLVPCKKCRFLVDAWTDECPECGADLSRQADAQTVSELEYIDEELVKVKRAEIDEQKRIEAERLDYRTVIQFRKKKDGIYGGLSRKIYELKDWVADVLIADGHDIAAINDFFSDKSDNDYWIRRFRATDIGKSPEKARDAYRKWL